MDQDKKQKAIEAAIEQIKKQTKDPEAVVRLGDEGQKKYSKGEFPKRMDMSLKKLNKILKDENI